MSIRSSQLPHPGERLATYFDKFFTTVLGVSTLGASLTFSKVISNPVQPWIDYGVSVTRIQDLLAISWLLFIIDLAFTTFAASALSLYRPQAIRYFGTTDSSERRIVMWYASLVSFVLFSLVIAAFVFLGMVVAAYAGPTGWVAVAFAGLFGFVGMASIVWQSPIGSKSIGDPMIHPHDSEQEYASAEKMDGLAASAFSGDGPFHHEEAAIQNRYGDISRANTVRTVEPIVPSYTTDLRRLRSVRASEDSRYEREAGRQHSDWVEVSRLRGHGNA